MGRAVSETELAPTLLRCTACYNLGVAAGAQSEMHELLAIDTDAGTRLDRFVAAHCPELSRSRVQELIDGGLLLVNGKTAKSSQKIRGGELITVQAQPRPAPHAEAEAIPLDVLYEDDDVMAINKAAGMTVHAGAGNVSGTLVNALLGRGQALSQGGDPLRPGIVHRLDKETSGVILVAKNDAAHAKLGEAFRQRAIKKTYIALVQGVLGEKSGRIELAIGRDPIHRTRMTTQRKSWHGAGIANPREARTDWKALAKIDGTTLVEVQLHTGRTHQIRVHFSALKHPVVGDTLYGAARELSVGVGPDPGGPDEGGRREKHGSKDPPLPRELGVRIGRSAGAREKVALAPLGRNFLHAARLGFAQPRTGAWIEVRATLPRELSDYLKKLCDAAGEPQSRIDAALAGYL
jgi:23S rRNA pseudouridine1911/1915/1917 synthase